MTIECSRCGSKHLRSECPFEPVVSVSIEAPKLIALEARDRVIWNEAIEAAALIVQPNPHIDEERRCEDIAEIIRKLKK